MLSTRGSDLHHQTLLIKQDDKFFSRLLSRELSMSRTNSKVGSFRGLPSSVPFVWESHPGTPKHRFHSGHEAETLPPLTPPPSFYSTTLGSNSSNKVKRQSSGLQTLFHKLSILKKASSSLSSKQSPSSPAISSYSTSSSSTWPSSVSSSRTRRRRSRLGSWGGYSSSSSNKVDEEEGDFIIGSPTSTLCFMIRRKQTKGTDLQKNGLIHVHEIVF